jgi:capsular exopolysaccharide synthesis family protein
MGRIDQALSRSNLDAAQGTGAETPAVEPSPWGVEPEGGVQAPELEVPPPAAPSEPGKDGRTAPWTGFDASAADRLVASKTAGPLMVEQFRSLAATLHRAQREQHIKSLIVTSPSPGDGKSHVAINVALTLSDSYRKHVLLVDADLRRPSLHQLFRAPNNRGLSQALKAAGDGHVTTVQISDRLTLLPAGRPEPNPLGGLSSDRMKHLVADAASQFDWVIVDSPPVGVLADAHLVSETVDAALLVVRAGVTRFEDLAAAAETIGRDRILGLVLNAVDPIEIRGQGYYHHYYGSDRAKA